MRRKQTFDLPAVFEATVVGLIELFRRYVVTLGLLLFRPNEYSQRLYDVLTTPSDDSLERLSGPFTFLLICWIVANVLADILASKFGIAYKPYVFPGPKDILNIGALIVHILSPLAALLAVYGIFSISFLLSKTRIPFYNGLALISYPLGFLFIVIIPYPVLHILIPKPLGGIISLFAYWLLFRRIFQGASALTPEAKPRLKWSLMSLVVIIILVGIVMFWLGWLPG